MPTKALFDSATNGLPLPPKQLKYMNFWYIRSFRNIVKKTHFPIDSGVSLMAQILLSDNKCWTLFGKASAHASRSVVFWDIHNFLILISLSISVLLHPEVRTPNDPKIMFVPRDTELTAFPNSKVVFILIRAMLEFKDFLWETQGQLELIFILIIKKVPIEEWMRDNLSNIVWSSASSSKQSSSDYICWSFITSIKEGAIGRCDDPIWADNGSIAQMMVAPVSYGNMIGEIGFTWLQSANDSSLGNH